MNAIAARVWVGSLDAASDETALAAAGITHIVNCLDERWEHAAKSGRRRTVLTLDMEDASRQSLAPLLPRALAFIDAALHDADAAVLIHCYAGASRSVAVGAAYLMQSAGLDAAAAVAAIRAVRPVANPLPSFVRQLEAWAAHNTTT